MSAKSLIRWVVLVATAMTALAMWTVPVQAEPTPPQEPACLNCHENLYYLYDTGKWYCVSEASTRCTNCHGGDAAAVQKESAHTNRTAHPIVDSDVSKCKQCHPQDYTWRVAKFDQVAGISPVVYASQPYKSASPVVVAKIPKGPKQTEIYLWSLMGGALLLIALGGITLYSKWLEERHSHRG